MDEGLDSLPRTEEEVQGTSYAAAEELRRSMGYKGRAREARADDLVEGFPNGGLKGTVRRMTAGA